jgi:hypothetical protein
VKGDWPGYMEGESIFLGSLPNRDTATQDQPRGTYLPYYAQVSLLKSLYRYAGAVGYFLRRSHHLSERNSSVH